MLFLLVLYCEATAQRQGYSAQLIDNRSKSISKEVMMSAETLLDLNNGFPSNWIDESEYLSVSLAYKDAGIIKEASSKNHRFTKEQLALIQQMPIGNVLEFTIDYLNTNSATNEVSQRQIKFSRCLVPSTPAKFISDEVGLDDYLREQIIDKVLANPLIYNSSANEMNGLPSVVVQFRVDEKGQVADLVVTHPSANEETNQLVKKALLAMPDWEPAMHDNKAVKQLFTLMVGDQFGC